MNKKIIYGFILILFAVCIFSGTALASSDGLEYGYGIDGTTTNAGSSTNPYAINDFADLQAISSSNWGTGVYYQQTADITLTTDITIVSMFGNYDGDGYEINGQNTYYIYFRLGYNVYLQKTRFKDISCAQFGIFVGCGSATNCEFINCAVGVATCQGGVLSTAGETAGKNCIGINCIVRDCTIIGGTAISTRYTGVVLGTASDSRSSSYSVSNCVVIDSTASGSQYNYKIAYSGSATLTNNYATNGGSSTTDSNGLSITSTQYNSQSWWEDTALYDFSSTGAWEWDSTTSLPKLKHSNSPPTVTVTTPTTPTAINTAISIEATGTPYTSGNALTFAWEWSNDNWATTNTLSTHTESGYVSTATYTPTSTGSYYFRVTVTETATGLTGTATTNAVTVVTAPTVSSSVSVSPTQGKLSTAYTPAFTFTISNLGNAETVYYKLQTSTDGTTYTDVSGKTGTATSTGEKSITSVSVTDTSATTHYYRVLVSSLSDYTASVTATSQSATFTTYAQPTTPVISEPNPSSILTETTEDVSLTGTSIPTAPSGLTYTYLWYYSESSTVTSSDELIGTWSDISTPYVWEIDDTTFPSAQTVYVYLKVRDSLSQTIYSNLQPFTISDMVALASFTGSTHGLGDTIQLSLSGYYSSVQWYYAVSGTTNWQSITGATSTTYTATGTSMGLDTGTYYFKVVAGSTALTTNSLTVYAEPIPNTPGAPLTPVSVPYKITLTASCSNEQVVQSYKWQIQNGGTWQDVATGQQYEPTLSNPGDYVYRFVAIGKSGNSVNSASVTVQAGYKPSASITSPATGTTFDVGERIDVQATVGGTAATYTWNFGSGTAETGTTTGTINAESTTISSYVKYNANSKGQKTITLTVTNIYGNTATYTISVTNGKTTRRNVATSTVTEVDSSGIYNLINNTAPMSANNSMPNLTAMVSDLTQPVTSLIGEWFYLLIFAVPYLIIFLRQKNLLIPSILGVLFAGALLVLLPGVALKAAIGILVLSIAGGIFGLYVKRHS